MKVEAAPLLGLQPALDSRALVSGIVVHDQVNLLLRRHLFFQVVQEPDELLGPVPWQTTANHFAIQDVERQTGLWSHGVCSRASGARVVQAATAGSARSDPTPGF